jgi:small GTP-binding protein
MRANDESYKEALEAIRRAEHDESTYLDLSAQLLYSLPPEIGKLTSLTRLDLRKNKLTSLPPEIGKLTKLTVLVLYKNQLTSLPPEIGKLTNLTALHLYNNQLTSLPPEIGKLTSLTKLRLHGNKLTSLPLEIGKLTNLAELSLEDNPLEIPPIEIASQGREAIRAYFEEIEEETSKLLEAKLLIVGQGDVGKTCLMNRLIRDKVDPEIMSTEGIDINRWSVKTKQADHFRVNCWDFGGQEIYHATHQFFLTKRSLYLFVWEARTDPDLLSFDYWLNTIKVLSDNSPVLVIQNKIDERKKPINQQGWKNKFPNIVEYHDVSALEATGIDTLKQVIIREIEKLPHIGDVLPKRWMDIRQRLEGLNENFIPYSHYQAICTEFGMKDEQTELLSEYYHDLGVFLCFKDNPILRNTIFLKPSWATNAVYKVTDNEQVKDNFGNFCFDELQYIWSDKNEFPPAKHVDLVELMKGFELCFELPTGQEYIIPELLRANQPKFDWDYAQNLRFKYKYAFMPAGVMTRFIVITHDLIKGNLYWKDGVVLAWENTEALIIKTDNRVIEMRINGDDKKTLLGMLRRHMGYIHSPFHNLEVNEMVPCICDECQKDPDPYFYPYHDLRKACEKHRDTIECRKSFDAVSIEALLGGIEKKTPEKRATKRQDIKIFLASSSELTTEREKIELFIGKENRKLRRQNIFLDLVIWEDLKQSFHGKRIQDYFNEKLLECDIVVCMFFKKVGEFTKEEFDVAYQHFKEDGKPRYLYVFFKSGNIKTTEIDKSILKFIELKDEIEEAEQIYKFFESDKDLIFQLKDQLDLIVPDIVYH